MPGTGNARARRSAAGLAVAALLISAGVAAGPAHGQQQVPGGTRDCQTVRVCNFARNATVRGCLSSYTCRRCRLVAARCKNGLGRVCQEMICSWGG